jgi:membrane fusion protein (multidrug efflux system)
MKVRILILMISISLLSAAGCRGDRGALLDDFLKGSSGAVPVTVESVVIEDKEAAIKVPATIRSSESIMIAAPKEITIDKIYVKQGDAVKAGDLMFHISEADTKAKQEQLKAELKELRAELDKNTYLMENRDRLLEEERIDQAQYDKIPADIEAVDEKMRAVQNELTSYGDGTSDNNITSPTGGVVAEVLAGIGMTFPQGRPLASISKVDSIAVEFELPSYEAQSVTPGMKVSVRMPDIGSESFYGDITTIGRAIDPTAQTFKVQAAVPNQKGFLKIGMPAEVEFTGSQRQRCHLISPQAIMKDHNRSFVFTVINGAAHKVEIVTKEKKGNKIEVSRGLRDGDLVVTKGQDKLTEGAVVDVWGR